MTRYYSCQIGTKNGADSPHHTNSSTHHHHTAHSQSIIQSPSVLDLRLLGTDSSSSLSYSSKFSFLPIGQLAVLLTLLLIVQTTVCSSQIAPVTIVHNLPHHLSTSHLNVTTSHHLDVADPPLSPSSSSSASSFSLYTLPHLSRQPKASGLSLDDIILARHLQSSSNKDNRHLFNGGAILNRSNYQIPSYRSSPPSLFVDVAVDDEEPGSCLSNCSGHGDCYNGTCFCEVEYSGGSCKDPNFKFYLSFSSVYYMICVVSFIQLMLCINSEIARQKPRSISRALRISTQKALYFFICLGTAIRGFYFSSPANVHIRWAESLMSAYYPILMSGSSLLVCFWAEVFHLDVSVERSRFLSKSFTGFILFNVVTYSMLLAELVLLTFANPTDSDKGFFLSIFNSIYAFLMLIVVIFFLIYGVEVYFKVRGAFIQEESCPADISQLQQSRLGLISQAVLLLVTILFMFSEVLGSLWKDKVPVLSRNYHQIMFRVVEFGVALWFPCVLWNCIQPEKLWILNPRRILKRRPNFMMASDQSRFVVGSKTVGESELLVGGVLMMKNCPIGTSSKSLGSCNSAGPECWICYESMESKPEAGPLIQPCDCRGDVSAVHHQCLLRWLMESYTTPNCPVHCKVCGAPYRMEHTSETVWLPAGLTISHWFKTAAIVTIMSSTLAGSCMIVKIFEHMYVKTISVGCAILVEYICLRLLGFNMISAYHRAKFSAIKIIGRKITDSDVPGDDHHYHGGDNINRDNPENPYQDPQCSVSQCYPDQTLHHHYSQHSHHNKTLPLSHNPKTKNGGNQFDLKANSLKSNSHCDFVSESTLTTTTTTNSSDVSSSSSSKELDESPNDKTISLPLKTLSEKFIDSGAEHHLCSSVGCAHSSNTTLD